MSEAPQWTERAADFRDWQDDEVRRWRLITTPWGGVLAIRDQVRHLELDLSKPVPETATIVRMEFKDETEARSYIRVVATEYALAKLSE